VLFAFKLVLVLKPLAAVGSDHAGSLRVQIVKLGLFKFSFQSGKPLSSLELYFRARDGNQPKKLHFRLTEFHPLQFGTV
jgi:hypothetical protein